MRIFSQLAARAGRVATLGLLVAACSVPAGAGSGVQAPSQMPTSSAVLTPEPRASFITAADAVAIVLALDPRFAGIAARNPGMIGQGSWYEVTPSGVGWHVTVQVGSGDCPAGCLDRHTWEYAVGADGTASLIVEGSGPQPTAGGAAPSEPAATARPAPSVQPGANARPVPTARPSPTTEPAPSAPPSPAGGGPGTPPVTIPTIGGPWLVGVALAGPVCPVERIPPDPACAPRPVAGATIAVLDQSGRTVATVVTAADGTYLVAVPAGRVRIAPARAAGMMRPPAPVDAVIPAGPAAWLRVDLDYDTGIR